ncbi:2-hydroxychromene-2-carboxylate isomerase/DsbA-like thioredoxin domain [Vibrio maritimus]|uniref:2-hydroxychromene-2-carboxylate isomerase/DsbA-like thioredoxin domain n=1 Tax=Vibrio maritimus TaxID=990268 RepID=A0A090RZV2_9VIBR|nr:2-hydroxychromene-2-carboxylate isomerase/DsbA-like thioredoxin domain [Vibrio maritimus]
MSQKIKLDVVSDVVCPWCIIGYKRLEQAIRELGVEDRIDLEWQPFELNPHMPLEGQNLREHLAEKYGTTKEDSIRARENLTNLGAELGFRFQYDDDMKMLNTFESHILLEYAKSQGKQTELKLRLFSAFFGEGKDISNREVLANELQAVGLDSKRHSNFSTTQKHVFKFNKQKICGSEQVLALSQRWCSTERVH